MNSGYWVSGVVRVVSIVLLALQISQAQTTVSISPPAKNSLPGGMFTLSVTIDNVANLHLYHVIVHFDNAVVRCDGVSTGGFFPGTFFLHSPSIFPSDTTRFVTVDDALAGLQSYSGSGTLFSLQFTALQVGVTTISLEAIVLRDDLNQTIVHSLVNGSVTVAIPSVVYVDQLYSPGNAGGHDFGFDAFSTISAGVSAVGSGGVVNVHPGTYREQIYINKNVALLGTGAANTLVAPPVSLMNQPFLPSRQERPIIGVDSLGTNVIIDGFTIDGEGAGDTQANMAGIQYFKSSGIVRHNTVKRVRSNPFNGAQAFVGIMVNHDYPRLCTHSVEIHDDSVFDFGKGGIVCNHPGTTGNVHHNVVIGQGPVGVPLAAQNGIQFGFGATGTAVSNIVANLSYTDPSASASGILGAGSDGTLEIANNTITETQTAINLQQTAFYPSGGTNANIEQNSVSASVAGTGVTTFHGLVTLSMGGALVRSHAAALTAIAPASPYGTDEIETEHGESALFRPLAAMAISLRKNSFVSASPGAGIGAYHLATETSPQTVTADSNRFSGNRIAVVTDKEPGAILNTIWRKNKFEGNNYGVVDQTGVLQDAIENWWGNTTGPRDVKDLPGVPNYNNPGGLGDSVTPFVDYKPWYLDPDMTTPSQQVYGMMGGWNIVSLPLTVDDGSKAAIFPTAVSYAYGFDIASGYVRKDTLLNGVGYWLKFASQEDVTINGLWRPKDTIEVVKGWNMIGTISDPVPAIMVQQVPPTIISSPFYAFDAGYVVADTLSPVKGYWVKTNYSGILILSSTGACLTKEIRSSLLSTDHASTLTVSDAHDARQTLWFSSEPFEKAELDYFELPPVPPAGIFDARFATNQKLETAKDGEVREIAIRASSAEYPLTITWEMKDQALMASLIVGTKEILMNGQGSVTVPDQKTPISLKLGGRTLLPREFALGQNYPNPFNPATKIKYQLPFAGFVTLKVYDILGRDVATLINGMEDAGYKTVDFDATALSTGVYFYRIQAGGFTDTKKFLLLR